MPDPILVKNLTLQYQEYLVLKKLSFNVKKGSVFVIMGSSGCGKSTLLSHLIGLRKPAKGSITLQGKDYWKSSEEEQSNLLRRQGVLFQGGALWTHMNLVENVALPLESFTNLSRKECFDLARMKLSLVGLGGFEEFYPSEISGGMKKRAGLARAMALDPEILFFDEPSAGLDPVTLGRLDELILRIRDAFGTTIVLVTHELASIFRIGEDAIFLDSAKKEMIDRGSPKDLLKNGSEKTRQFLSGG